MSRIIAIGGGQASFSFIQRLRSIGYKEKITLISDEDVLPYQRPPLSKKYLLGKMAKEQLFFRPESYYHQFNIDCLLGTKVINIDRDKKKIEMEDGSDLSYDKIFLGTGSSPRKLPDHMVKEIKGIYYVRSIRDLDLVSKRFFKKQRLLIIGGGYIGLEIAAVARILGLEVALIESERRILKRVASTKVADFFRDLHKKNGIKLKENTLVEKFISESGNVKGVLTNWGERIHADFVIAGIGIKPNMALAETAGVMVQNGILVDRSCRTSDPDIFAAGDCTSFPYQGQRIRLESVGNAIEQSEVAAEGILGKETNYKALPWFWSDQFDTKLQIAGINFGYTDVVERINGEKISYWYYKDGNLNSVDAINDPISYMVGKKLIDNHQTPNPKDIRSEGFNLKSLLRG